MPRSLELARVLVVDDELSSRLTLQTLLEAGGYSVDVAGSAAEAFSKLDEGQYELVLSEAEVDSPQAGVRVLSYARMKPYQPATALVTAYREDQGLPLSGRRRAAGVHQCGECFRAVGPGGRPDWVAGAEAGQPAWDVARIFDRTKPKGALFATKSLIQLGDLVFQFVQASGEEVVLRLHPDEPFGSATCA